METNSPSAVRVFKSVVAVLGSIAFFIASLAVALSARGYQVSGQLMPNGKGGFMTFREGYLPQNPEIWAHSEVMSSKHFQELRPAIFTRAA